MSQGDRCERGTVYKKQRLKEKISQKRKSWKESKIERWPGSEKGIDTLRENLT